MDIQDARQEIRNNVKLETVNPPKTGGQSCGLIYSKQRLYSEDLDLTIETGYHRSSFKNRELLLKLFDLALDDLIR